MSTRTRTKGSRRADGLFGFLIPLFFLFLAAYQEIHDHHVDRYVAGILLVFGLGALGFRIDVLLERYLESRGQGSDEPEEEQS